MRKEEKMDIFAICGCAVTACVLIVTIKQQRPDMAVLLSVAACAVLLALLLSGLRDTVEAVRDMLSSLEAYAPEMLSVLRALGVCLVTQLASDVCRDAGQASVASKVELGGRIAALSLMLPLLSGVLHLTEQIINE